MVRGDLERAARAGGRLLEDERDRQTREAGHLRAGVASRLQVGGEAHQVVPLVHGEVELLEEGAVAQVERHGVSLDAVAQDGAGHAAGTAAAATELVPADRDRKSTRMNSSH